VPTGVAGAVHVVRPGETLWRISRRYGVSIETIMRVNRISDVREVPVGARLRLPGGRDRGEAGLPPPPPQLPAGEHDLAFAWPVHGRLTSGFGRRPGRRHDGIDVSAPRGTPIRAAAAGRVIYSGSGLGAYGNTVIVKHQGEYRTVYAHARRLLVRRGDFVVRGQVVAEVGSTGNATGPHLHFEVRRHDRAQDPLVFLPGSTSLARNP
jgi:murein DD-endopeptidase MepM/ murein hydrolase activator NlpD